MRTIAWIIGLASLGAGAAAARAQSADGGDPLRFKRLVWRFDFDERAAGNLEALPMFWSEFRGDGFPAFVRGGFDAAVGHDAPPSFRLDLDGRNVAFRYAGPHTCIRPGSEYVIEGWVRADALKSARAALSAYYLDRRGAPIPGTQRFSPLVGGERMDGPGFRVLGAGANAPDSRPESSVAEPPRDASPETAAWQKVSIRLEPGPIDADRIGLTAWAVQSDVWQVGPRPRRAIERNDITGGTWFDDISIFRLPTITMRPAAIGSVFVAPEPPTMLVTVADEQTQGLSAVVKLLSGAGELLREFPIAAQTSQSAASGAVTSVALGKLDPGIYTARLEVLSRDAVIVTRSLTFACVEASPRGGSAVARSFGVCLEAGDRSEPDAKLALIAALGAGSAKLPLWSGAAGALGSPGEHGGEVAFLQELIKRRVALTGVFAAPPSAAFRSADAFPRALLDVLSDDPADWRDALAGIVAPYSSIFRAWQVGADGDDAVPPDPRLPTVLARLRTQLKPLLSNPELSGVGSVDLEAGGQLPADYVTLAIDRSIDPAWIGAHLAPYRRLGYRQVAAWIEPEDDRYPSGPKLARWAERIIHTRHAGAATVYVPQLWSWRPEHDGVATEPTEEFIVFRTIATVLGDAIPSERIHLAEGVTCLSFIQGESAILALWDASAPPEGRVHPLQVGAAVDQIDVWGRVTPLPHAADGRQQVRLWPAPVFVRGVERWLAGLYTSVTFTPTRVEFSLAAHQHKLHLMNPATSAISVDTRLIVPEGWEAQPDRLTLNLPPRGEADIPVTLRYPANEPAGPKRLTLAMRLVSDSSYYVEIPLPLELGLEDVEVWGYAFMEGDRLVIRHGVTNRSRQTLNLRSSAIVPGRQKQTRPLTGLAPGQNVTAEYRVPKAQDMSGRVLRLTLREVNGNRIHNIEVIAP